MQTAIFRGHAIRFGFRARISSAASGQPARSPARPPTRKPDHLNGAAIVVPTKVQHLPDTVDQAVTDSSTGPEHIAVEADSTRQLSAHIDELPSRRRTLSPATPVPYTEIATITGIPRGGIGRVRNRGLQQLRERLDQLETVMGAGWILGHFIVIGLVVGIRRVLNRRSAGIRKG